MPATKVLQIANLIAMGSGCFVALAAPVIARADVIIDSFQGRPGSFPITIQAGPDGRGSGVIGAVLAYAGVSGGRGIGLDMADASASDSVFVDIKNISGSTFLDYESTSGASGELILNYGTDQESPPPSTFFSGNPSPMALQVVPANDFIRITFLSYNNTNNQDMQIGAIFESGSFPNDLTSRTTTSLSATTSQFVDLPLNSFPTYELDSMTLFFDAPEGTQFELGSVTLMTVAPEPESGLVFAIGASLLLKRSHKSYG